MSDMELKQFEIQLDLLSFSEQLMVIEYLVNLMQKKQETFVIEEAKKEERIRNVEKLFAFMDAHPIKMNGEKWTREELYER